MLSSRCFREKPSEETGIYSREKDCSLRIEEKIIIVFTMIMTMILVTVKKTNTSHNKDMNNDNLEMDKLSFNEDLIGKLAYYSFR